MKIPNELIEAIAKQKYAEWVRWSTDIAKSETISKERLERWQRIWNTPWEKLEQRLKDVDVKLAMETLEAIEAAGFEFEDMRVMRTLRRELHNLSALADDEL